MELIYRFQETGEGCAEHADPSCLCDVSLDRGPVPITTIPRLAPFPHHLDSPAISFVVWGSMTLGRFEALKNVNEAELNEALAIWEGHTGPDNASRQASLRVQAASKCLKAGLTIEQTARWLSTEVWSIMDLFWPRTKHALILEMEKMLRAGATAREVAEALGIKQQWASDVARRWNVVIPHSGVRYGPADRAKARELVKSGKSRRAAGRELGISESRVSRWCEDLPVKPPGRRKGPK